MDSDREMRLGDEIDALVQVAPSHAFTARVRERLKRERVGSALLVPWPWLALGAAVVALLIVMIGIDRTAPTLEPPPGRVSGERGSASPAISPTQALPPRVTERHDRGAPVERIAASPGRQRADRPAVLISPEEAEGIALLVASIEDGRLSDAVFDGAPQVPESIDIESAAVESIHVEPLAPIISLEGAIP